MHASRVVRKLLVLFSALCIPLCAQGADTQLNLFIWSEYIDPVVVKEFEASHRCRVVIDLYEDEAAMMSKLQGGGASLYDVVVPPDHKVTALIKLKLIAPLRHEKLPNLKNVDPKFLNASFDPGNRYTVPYQWGTLGLYVRPDGNSIPQPTWGLLFDPNLQPGPFVLMDNSRDLIGAALKFLGHSLNSTDQAHLKQARDLLIQTKRRCLSFDGSVAAKNKVLSKLARAGMVYSGEGARGVAEDSKTVYLIPKEGSQIWQDNLAVLARAPHRELAETFINFLLEPKVAARISEFTQFATVNKAAHPYIKPAILNDPAIYPPAELMPKLEFLQDLGAKSRMFDELWTQIKAR